MLNLFLFFILFFRVLQKNTESYINSNDNSKNYLDTETFFENMNTQPIIHDTDSVYDIYDKIDNSNKFRRLKDIVCYSDHYCVPTPEFVSRNLSDL